LAALPELQPGPETETRDCLLLPGDTHDLSGSLLLRIDDPLLQPSDVGPLNAEHSITTGVVANMLAPRRSADDNEQKEGCNNKEVKLVKVHIELGHLVIGSSGAVKSEVGSVTGFYFSRSPDS
jgi:hypothetical protein